MLVGGLSIAAASALFVGVGSTKEAVEVDAEAVNGTYRFNVLTNSSEWLTSNYGMTINFDGTDRAMSRDSDFPVATNSSYSTVTVNSVQYSWITIEMTKAKRDSIDYGNAQLKRNGQWDAFWTDSSHGNFGIQHQFALNYYDNTIILSDDGNWNFTVSGAGWWVKATLHTGANNANTSTIFMNCASSPDVPDDTPSGKHFVGWYTDPNHKNWWESGTQYDDINLYAYYEEDVDDGYYIRGDWGSDNYGWSWSGQKPMVLNNNVAKIEDLPLGKDGRVKVIYIYQNKVTQWYTPTTLYPLESDDEGFYIENDVDGNTVVSADGLFTVEFYWNDTTPCIRFTQQDDEGLTPAKEFAVEFVEAMYSNCKYNYKTESVNPSGSYENVATAWASYKTEFATLISNVPAAEKYLKTSFGSTVKEITTFWEVYDYVFVNISEVNSVEGNDFLSRTPTDNRISLNVGTYVEQNNSFVFIIIGSVALVGVGLVLIRRKEN